MKKQLLCLLLPLFVLTDCNKKANSPQYTAIEFFNALYNENDLEKAESMCTEDSKANLRSSVRAIQGAFQLTGDNPNEFEHTIIEEKSSVVNDTAIMTVKTPFDTLQLRLVNINDEWKVDYNYDTNVIDKELIDDVLEVMKPFVDSVEAEEK